MRPLLSLLVCFLLVGVLSAQTGGGEIENWVEARSICAEAGRELIEIRVSDAITEIVVRLSDPAAAALIWYPSGGKMWHFWVDSQNEYVAISAFVGGTGFSVEEIFLGNEESCEGIADGPEMRECLGMSFESFVNMIGYRPMEEGFVVDGRFYLYHGNLSFLVPEEAIWTWDLYADNRHVLRFEQSAAMPCTVTEVYPQ